MIYHLHQTVDVDADGISCVDVYYNDNFIGEIRNASIPDIDDIEEVDKFEEVLMDFLKENYY